MAAGCPRQNSVIGLAMGPASPFSTLSLTQQGYDAIRVSEDEVLQSINRGTTTGGVAAPADGVSVGADAAGKGHRGLPMRPRWVVHELLSGPRTEETVRR